jgi:hypothetical protein
LPVLRSAGINMEVLKRLKNRLERFRIHPNLVSNFIMVWTRSKIYNHKSTHQISTGKMPSNVRKFAGFEKCRHKHGSVEAPKKQTE